MKFLNFFLPFLFVIPFLISVIPFVLKIPRERNVFPLINLVGTGAVSFIFSVLALGNILFTEWTLCFFTFQDMNLYWGGKLDLFCGRYLLVCLIINLFCKTLMIIDKQDVPESQPRFFVYLDLFLIAAFIAITSNYFFSFFVGWELFGIVSYLFLSFSYEDRAANQGAFMAFLFDRFGSILLLFAGAISFFKMGDLSFGDPHWRAIDQTFLAPLFFTALYIRLFQFGVNTWFMHVDKCPSLSLGLVSSFIFGIPGFLIIQKWGIFESSLINIIALYGGTLSLVYGIFMAFQEALFKRLLMYLNMAQWGGVLIAAAFGKGDIFLYPFMVFSVLQIIMFGLDKDLSMNDMRGLKGESPLLRVFSKKTVLALVFFWALFFMGMLAFLSTYLLEHYPAGTIGLAIGGAVCSMVIWRLFFWLAFAFPSPAQNLTHSTDDPWIVRRADNRAVLILKIGTAILGCILFFIFFQTEIAYLNILNFIGFSSILLFVGPLGWSLVGFFFKKKFISGFSKEGVHGFLSGQAYLQPLYEKGITRSFKWISTSLSEKIDIFLIEEQAFQGTLGGLKKVHHFFENAQQRAFSSHALFILVVCIGLLLFMMLSR